MKLNRKITNLLINPKYQMKYIFWITASGMTLIALNSALTYHYVSENYETIVALSPMTDEVRTQLYRELNEIISRMALISFLFLLCFVAIGLVLSHRTAGPMYHLKRVFHEIKSGNNKARVHLRPKDDFKEIAEDFNAMMDQVQSKP